MKQPIFRQIFDDLPGSATSSNFDSTERFDIAGKTSHQPDEGPVF